MFTCENHTSLLLHFYLYYDTANHKVLKYYVSNLHFYQSILLLSKTEAYPSEAPQMLHPNDN